MFKQSLGFISVFLVLLFLCNVAYSANVYWDGGGSNNEWDNSDNWEYGDLPDGEDNVYVEYSGEDILVNYRSTTSLSLNSLYLGAKDEGLSSNVAHMRYWGDKLYSRYLYLGMRGSGMLSQADSSLRADLLSLGEGLGGYGSYSLTNGTLSAQTISLGGYISGVNAGYGGYGEFVQNGGSVFASNGIYIANGRDSANENSIYSLRSGGEVASRIIHLSNSGTFRQESGSVSIRSLNIKDGEYWLNSGGLAVSQSGVGDVDVIGNEGNGTFHQSGGSHSVIRDIVVGYNGGTGNYEMTGGELLVSGNAWLGRRAYSSFTGESGRISQQMDSTVTISGDLNIGAVSGTSGVYEISNLSQLHVRDNLNIGGYSDSEGRFMQNGTTVNVNGNVRVRRNGIYEQEHGSFDIGGGLIVSEGGKYYYNAGYDDLSASYINNVGEFLQKNGQIDANKIYNNRPPIPGL